MIIDRLDNWQIYFRSPVWETVFIELLALNSNTPAMEKKIKGDEVILKVFSCETIDANSSEAELESHKKYIDIHTAITKSEKIKWFPTSGLKIIKPYDAVEDAMCYEIPKQDGASLVMHPGSFAVFWPGDAHMPGLQVAGKPEMIMKAVMKISIDLVRVNLPGDR
jgi:YhcH/YjgK/YiaL family protein